MRGGRSRPMAPDAELAARISADRRDREGDRHARAVAALVLGRQLDGGTIRRSGACRLRAHPRDVEPILPAQETLAAHPLAAAPLRRVAIEGRDLHGRLPRARQRSQRRCHRHHDRVDGSLYHPKTQGLGSGV